MEPFERVTCGISNHPYDFILLFLFGLRTTSDVVVTFTTNPTKSFSFSNEPVATATLSTPIANKRSNI